MRVTDEMVLAGAREVCARWSAACGVDPEDNWKIYSDEHKAEARAILEAALSHAAGQDGEQCRAASGDYRWLEELRERMEHCVSAADEGEDYAVPREMLDAMTTLGLMEKVGRGRWAPTGAGREFAERKPTLPIEIYGKCYEVPIRVQLHIVNLEEKLRALSRGVPEGE